MKRNYIITIARGFGSGGKDIGSRLAAELGIPCYERQILKMASENSGLSESLFHEVDEKLRVPKLVKRLRGLFDSNAMPDPESRDFTSDDALFQLQAEIIRDLANHTSCVIIGKCANKILERWTNVISVYIEAPRSYCEKSIMKMLGVEREEAARMISKTDKYRADYYHYYTGGDYWTNPVSYDLTLNSERVGRENCVRLIREYLLIKFGGDICEAPEG
jgi:cytidylate kinase